MVSGFAKQSLTLPFAPLSFSLLSNTDAREQCIRLSIRKLLKGKKVSTRIEPHAQQMTNHEQETTAV